MRNQRNAALDTAKFLAMYLVVFGHFFNERADNAAVLVNFVHMPLLFFISGYLAVFSIERRTVGSVVKKKVKTLLIPYIFWSGISLLANTVPSVLGGNFTPDKMHMEAVEIFLYARSVWFLIQLFVTFLIFLAVRQILQVIGGMKYAVLVHVVVWLLLAFFVSGEPFAFYKFKWLFPFWGAGYLIGKNREWLHRRYRMIEWAALLYPILAAVFFQKDMFWEYTRFDYHDMRSALYGVLYYMISTVGVVFLMTLAHWISQCTLGRVCAEIGTYSMDIYVIHMFFVKLVPIPIDLHNVGHVRACIVVAFLSLAVTLIVWGFSKGVFRKIRLYRLLVGASGS